MDRVRGMQEVQGRFDLTAPDQMTDYDMMSERDLMVALLAMLSKRLDITRAVETFGNVWNLLNAPLPALKRAGITADVAASLRMVRSVALRMQAAELKTRPVINTHQKLLDYLTGIYGEKGREECWVLFLDRKLNLITAECQGKGTVDHCPIYKREVIRRSFELDAASIILSHNHPSKDATPSKGDIDMTKEIQAACAAVGICLIDHIIIGKNSYSMKANGLI